MFTFGFSYVGVIYLLMLFTPNIFWAKRQPQGYSAAGENKVLLALERAGEVLCTCCVLIFSDFNLRATLWGLWLGLSFLLMILYEVYWIHYFRSSRTLLDFYRPFLGIPVPGATLPVLAFFLLGIYGSSSAMILCSIILGIGHIGIHMGHYKKLEIPRKKPGIRILKGFLCGLLCVVLAIPAFFIGARNIHYLTHYHLIRKGVDEGIYVELGGQEQYLLLRGADAENPVIVFLHGGPSSPESYVNYCWVDDLTEDFTIVDWDQRGCGRTYVRNCAADPDNDSASFEQALADLDELVDYVSERFGQQQVILVGHSYGTVLAARYIEQNPEKVSAYIGIAQVVSMDENNHVLADEALAEAESTGQDPAALEQALAAYDADPSVSTTLTLRQEASQYLPEALSENSTWIALTSPYMGMPDLEWFLKQLEPTDTYIALNQQLYDSLLDFDLYEVDLPEDLPVTFISGALDQACPVSTISDYLEQSGLNGQLYTIEGCGHNVQYTKPEAVSEIIQEVLQARNFM